MKKHFLNNSLQRITVRLNTLKINVPLNRVLQVGPPTNVVLVTCISSDLKPNIITLGMYMPISHNPPLVAIGVSPKRYSHKLIQKTKEFVINVPSKDLVKQTILCGSVSGRKIDKIKETKLTLKPAKKVKPLLINECISNLECKNVASYLCGDHTLFIGEVIAAHVEKELLKKTLDIVKAKTLSHKGGHYFIPKFIYEA
jgi:flavin reductase (DIM6/NTAB) family NADH-FMN oxidoreductase RutF